MKFIKNDINTFFILVFIILCKLTFFRRMSHDEIANALKSVSLRLTHFLLLFKINFAIAKYYNLTTAVFLFLRYWTLLINKRLFKESLNNLCQNWKKKKQVKPSSFTEDQPPGWIEKVSKKSIRLNTKVSFKGCCSLWLAFDYKGHVTNNQQWPISYLHAKFEQNRSLNTKLTFKGRCGLWL